VELLLDRIELLQAVLGQPSVGAGGLGRLERGFVRHVDDQLAAGEVVPRAGVCLTQRALQLRIELDRPLLLPALLLSLLASETRVPPPAGEAPVPAILSPIGRAGWGRSTPHQHADDDRTDRCRLDPQHRTPSVLARSHT